MSALASIFAKLAAKTQTAPVAPKARFNVAALFAEPIAQAAAIAVHKPQHAAGLMEGQLALVLAEIPSALRTLATATVEDYFKDQATIDYLRGLLAVRSPGNGHNATDYLSQFNAKQLCVVGLIACGYSLTVLGSAGVGKTTCIRVGLTERKRWVHYEAVRAGRTAHIEVLACAFTRQATGVLASKMGQGVRCVTVHKLLGFRPVVSEGRDKETGLPKVTRMFKPLYCAEQKLPLSVRTIAIDEASMLGSKLNWQLEDALSEQHPPQIIRVGDHAQLAPVLDGSSLMRHLASASGSVVELDHIYRTQKGPVLDIAYACRNGTASKLTDKELLALAKQFPDEFFYGVNMLGGKEIRDPDVALKRVIGFITDALTKGDLDVNRGDMILCPYNDNFGVKPLNRAIAEFYDRRDNRLVYTIQAGFQRHYLAVGDKIRVNNEPAFALKIMANLAYNGRGVPDASRAIDRQGHHIQADGSRLDPELHSADGASSDFELDLLGGETLDSLSEAQGLTPEALQIELARLAKEREAGTGEDATRKNMASHRVYFRYAHQGSVGPDGAYELDEEQYIDVASEFNLENAGLLNYASTVHKSQGSEGHHVLLALHRTHASHLSRETLYTAITRARVKLTILTCPGLMVKGASASQFPGHDWKGKASNYVAKHGAYEPTEAAM